MESGNKKMLEGLTIGQKRKRNNGMNIATIQCIDMHSVFMVAVTVILQSKIQSLNQTK